MNNSIILLIKFYQKGISPFFPNSCRFYPTCSAFTIEALQKYGMIKGFLFSASRIVKCHPFNKKTGFDPLP